MIVIGDVHGCFTTLLALLNKLPRNRELCFLGDLIDRGPDSYKVVEFVKGKGHKCVLGNHEDMALKAYDNPLSHHEDLWIANGGRQTLKSYPELKISSKHLSWFAGLPYFIEYKNYVMSHSNFAHGIDKHDAKTLTIWNRDTDTVLNDGRINVIGHTPSRKVVSKDGLIIIDTACVFGNSLTAYDLDNQTFFSQEFIG